MTKFPEVSQIPELYYPFPVFCINGLSVSIKGHYKDFENLLNSLIDLNESLLNWKWGKLAFTNNLSLFR